MIDCSDDFNRQHFKFTKGCNDFSRYYKMMMKRMHLFLPLLIFLAACAPAAVEMPTPASSATQQPSASVTHTLQPTVTPEPTATPTLTPTATPAVLVGAGDIAICGQEGDDQTAALLDDIPGVVFTTGDNVNEDATLYQFETCFDPSWGRFKDRIRPAAGNHEYKVDHAADYFAYFGEAAGKIREGWYSYDVGDWHIIVLNSACLWVDGCGPSSPQVAWLKEDLAAHPTDCTLAYWHDPRWSSGLGGSAHWLDAFWQELYAAGVEVVLSSDDHNYERFAPQDPQGKLDEAFGIRQFVIGTGGASQRPYQKILENSEVFNSGTYGVLKFNLYSDRYEWEFIPVEGGEFTDSGSGVCHPAPEAVQE